MSSPQPTVLITGGEGDLAVVLTEIFLAEKWQVFHPGRRELDVTSESSVQAYFQQVDSLDLLINNAGVIDDQLLTQMSGPSWDQVLAVNLRGAFLCTRQAVELMRPRRQGQVIFIGSRAARFGTVGQSNYAAAKAALIGLAQSLAKEYGPDNLRFNVVLPGFLETKMNAQLSLSQKQLTLRQHALGRFNTLSSAARTIAFLASLDHVSGQVFQLDSRVEAWT